MELLKEYLEGVEIQLKRHLPLEDHAARDERDQWATATLAYLAGQESELSRQMGDFIRNSTEKSTAATEMALKGTEAYALLIYVKRMNDALIEHIRGLRSHSKRQYEERLVNET